MRPHTPADPRRPGPRTGALALVIALVGVTAAVGPVACAGKRGASGPDSPPGVAHRNRMEAPPPFPSAPDFKVADQAGAERSLDSLMGRKGLVLVLYRGHW